MVSTTRIPVMLRIALAIVMIAAVACTHPSSLKNTQPQHPEVTDSNFVSAAELEEEIRLGHTFLYDALKSTRPEMLKSAGQRGGPEQRGWPWVYFDNPLGFAWGPFTNIRELENIQTARVKWIRWYWSTTAPFPYQASTASLLVVALR